MQRRVGREGLKPKTRTSLEALSRSLLGVGNLDYFTSCKLSIPQLENKSYLWKGSLANHKPSGKQRVVVQNGGIEGKVQYSTVNTSYVYSLDINLCQQCSL